MSIVRVCFIIDVYDRHRCVYVNVYDASNVFSLGKVNRGHMTQTESANDSCLGRESLHIKVCFLALIESLGRMSGTRDASTTSI